MPEPEEGPFDVVVMGAGLGGLSAAAYLSSRGHRVIVLEQHDTVGGFATSFVRGRFEFEVSLHELSSVGSPEQPGAVRRFLEDELGVQVAWCAVPEAYRVILTDSGADVRLPFGIEAFIDAVSTAVPGSRDPVRTYVNLCKDVHDVLGVLSTLGPSPGLKDVITRARRLADTREPPFRGMREAARKLDVFLRTMARTVDDVVLPLGVPRAALDLMHPYWAYLGIPMSRLNFTIWAAMLIEYLEYGAYVPRQRSQALSEALAARILETGGRIETRCRVERILLKNGRVDSVETSGGNRILTRQVISNASPTTVFTSLIQPISHAPEPARKLVHARRLGASAFAVYLGLDASPDDLGLDDYGYMIASHMNTDLIYASTSKLEAPDMQAAICLNRAVPDASPPGTTILSITTLFRGEAWAEVKPETYVDTKTRIADQLIGQFERATGTRIRDHIEEIEIATPVTFARYAGTPWGGIYGYELDPWDAVIPRVLAAPRERFVPGLDFAGGYATMGHGFSSALLSGREVARTVAARLERSS